MEGFSFSTDVRIRFAETDAQGIAHHASFVVWLEVARVAYLAEHAGGYQAIRDRGIEALTTEVCVRYHRAAYFDETLDGCGRAASTSEAPGSRTSTGSSATASSWRTATRGTPPSSASRTGRRAFRRGSPTRSLRRSRRRRSGRLVGRRLLGRRLLPLRRRLRCDLRPDADDPVLALVRRRPRLRADELAVGRVDRARRRRSRRRRALGLDDPLALERASDPPHARPAPGR